MTNKATQVLEVLYANSRITTALIHAFLRDSMNYAQLENTLRALVEIGQVETDARGLYLITAKGLETLQDT